MTKEELIRENRELKARLELAEKWMRREIKGAITHLQGASIRKKNRNTLHLLIEDEGLDIMTKRVHDTFSDVLIHAPKYTFERLIDAEIYWSTLQKYATMDGLPVILAYQKILDAWIEEVLIRTWRIESQNQYFQISHEYESIERDLINILTKNYTLSIGRWYQLLENFRTNTPGIGSIQTHLIENWKSKNPELVAYLLSDDFFLPFQKLIHTEIFSRKRHENKVTYTDTKQAREIIPSLLLRVFSFGV